MNPINKDVKCNSDIYTDNTTNKTDNSNKMQTAEKDNLLETQIREALMQENARVQPRPELQNLLRQKMATIHQQPIRKAGFAVPINFAAPINTIKNNAPIRNISKTWPSAAAAILFVLLFWVGEQHNPALSPGGIWAAEDSIALYSPESPAIHPTQGNLPAQNNALNALQYTDTLWPIDSFRRNTDIIKN